MAYSKITTNKRGVLQAKIQAYGLDPATGKSKLYVKTIHNVDGLSEAKFKKYVTKAEIEFEESIKLTGKTSALDGVVSDGVLTFTQLVKEWKATVLQNLSKSYYSRICDTEGKFTEFLVEHHLADKPISAITVRHVQLFLNSFCSGERTATNLAKLKNPLPDSINFREMIRKKIINANSLYRLKHLEGGVNISTAKNICKYCHIKFDDYFEQIFKVREYSAETIKGHRRILRTIFNEAVRYEWITKNPVCKTKVGASTSSCNISLKPVEEKEVFSLTEVKQFLKLLDELPEDLIYRRVTLKFMVLTGVRTAELHGLRWSDFDFDKRIVHIRRNRLATDGFGIYEKDPKSRTSKRDIPLPAELLDDLRKYMDWFRLADDEFDSKLDEYYFSVNIFREPEGTSSTGQWLAKFEKKHGLKRVSPHGLRHTYCSILLAQNVPIQTVSKYLGHSDSTITLEVYSHFIPDTQERVTDALSNLLNS